jgi:tetratricopeptide (TPR) repeat protein
MTQHPDAQPAKDRTHPPSPHGLSMADRQRLEEGYREGLALLQQARYDHDRAHELFLQCVLADPDNLLYVDALLTNLGRKYEHHRRGLPIHLLTGRDGLKQALTNKPWKEVLRLGLNVLKHNPWDRGVLLALAQVCEAREYYQAEWRYLQNAVEAEPEDPDLNRQLAKSLARLARYEEAVQCWQRVEAADRYDAEAPRMISALTLEKARSDSRIVDRAQAEPPAPADDLEPRPTEGAASSAAPRTPAVEPHRKTPKLVLSRRQQLEQALVNNPEDETTYLELADLHLAEHRTFDAQRTLLKAVNVSKDVRILERLEEVNMLRAREQLDLARRRAAEEGTQEARQLVERLKDEIGRLELEIFTRRCERNPQDPQLKFQLGLRLKQVGNYRQALEPLQGGLAIPAHRAVASLEIGEILQSYKQFPRALQCYRQAVQLAAADALHQDCRKRALYRAGMLAMSMKLMDSAQQYLSELVRIAPDYRDAKTHLDKLNEIGEDF